MKIRRKIMKDTLSLWGWPAAAGVAMLAVLLSWGVSPDFSLLIVALGGMCYLLSADINGRRKWEREASRQIKALMDHHDRLVRETARNRNDIVSLKEGLSEIASTVETQGRKLSPSSSAEARMIETLVGGLGGLGVRPRRDLRTEHDSSILELEMAPPPPGMPPESELERELNPSPWRYSDSAIRDILRNAVRDDLVDLYMQPVVTLPQRKPRMLEIFARIRTGSGIHLPAARYLDLAREEGLIPAIDNLLLLRCMEGLRQDVRNPAQSLPRMINITRDTLKDRGFMGDLAAFLSRDKQAAFLMIFEMTQEEFDAFDADDFGVIEGLSRLGCRFSLDHVRKRRIDIGQMKNRHIRFIKMSADWLLREGGAKAGFSRIIQLRKQLDAAGIDLIVEKIESEAVLRELLDFSVDMGQGYLFGKPDMNLTLLKPARAA